MIVQSALLYFALVFGLFILAFLSKRRFGVLGLALAVGSILSDIWTDRLLTIAKNNGIVVENFAPIILAVLVTLLPVVIFLFKGYSYRNFISRLVGSGLFALLGLAFLIEPLSHNWVVQGVGGSIFGLILDNRLAIIGVGLILVIIDYFIARPSHENHKHHKEPSH